MGHFFSGPLFELQVQLEFLYQLELSLGLRALRLGVLGAEGFGA